MMAIFKRNKASRASSVSTRIVRVFFMLSFIGYSVTTAGLWMFSNMIIERGMTRQAAQLLQRFDDLGTLIYFGEIGTALQHIATEANRLPAIGSVQYYDLAGTKILGGYSKPDFTTPPHIIDDSIRNQAEKSIDGTTLVSRSLGVVSAIQIIAPIKTQALENDDLLDIGLASTRGENSETIGWVELNVDLRPARSMVSTAIISGAILLSMITLMSILIGRGSVRRALRPLADLEIPLQKVAHGDFNVVIKSESTDREIAAITDAISAAIAGVRQRDAEKEEAIRARISAEAANSAKSVFLANMSHEIRTPLNGILGFLGLLGKTTLDRTQHEYLKTIDISAKTLLTVINDILDFSKIEAGRMNIESVDMDLCQVIESAITLHAANAEAKHLDLTLVCSSMPPTIVRGDPARLTQVISNLVGNAIKFTERGSVTIRSEIIKHNDYRVIARVTVQDTGIGMSNAVQTKLFHAFTQADSSTTRKHGGTGLGLVISKKLLDLMNGVIEVDSVENKGSTFTITLDLARGTPIQATEVHEKLSRLKVLVSTANNVVGQSLIDNLQSWRIDATLAHSGAGTFALLEAAKSGGRFFDILLIENDLPDSTAEDMLDAIRRNSEIAHLHTVLLCNLSADNRPETLDRGEFNGVLFKPIKSSDLFNELVNCFVKDKLASSADHYTTAKVHLDKQPSFRALVVEDNEINRKLAAILLSEFGAEVTTAENGRFAINAAQTAVYDLILMDIHMPVMDGVAATKAIRALAGKNSQVPIIALTANALGGDRERFLAAGMDDYLSKPLNAKALQLALEHWVGNTTKPLPLPANTVVAPTNGKLAIIDPAHGIKNSLGRPGLWREVRDMLLRDLPAQRNALLHAFNTHAHTELQRIAHKLGGSSSACGTIELCTAARALEAAIKSNAFIEIETAYKTLHQSIEKLLALKNAGRIPDTGDPAVY
ncbi:MAG: response regulator [Pseudomonadota bacterium]